MQYKKSIETIFDGWNFCSELDARWGVFFKTLGIVYRYTSIGHLYSYFWIDTWKSFVVVVPDRPTGEQINLCKMLATHTGVNCLLIRGAPFAHMEDAFLSQWTFSYRFMIIPPRCHLSLEQSPLQRQYTVSEEIVDHWCTPQCNDLDLTCCVFALAQCGEAMRYIDVEHGTLTEPVTSAYNDGYGTLAMCDDECSDTKGEPCYDDYRLIAAYATARIAQF